MYQAANRTFTVVLHDGHAALTVPVRLDAEVLFARELERVLGGAEFVADTYAAWLEVTRLEAHRIHRSTALTAARWPVALAAAKQAVLERLSAVGEAQFEICLERTHVRAA